MIGTREFWRRAGIDPHAIANAFFLAWERGGIAAMAAVAIDVHLGTVGRLSERESQWPSLQ
ncbi:MAG: hypothetical protein AB7O57_08360 [Hyphomicrobiaceae bacterium]